MAHRVRIFSIAAAALVAVSASAQTTQNASAVEARIHAQIAELAAIKAKRTPAQKKIDSVLLDTLTMWKGQRISKTVAKVETGIWPDTMGRIVVDLQADVSPLLLGQLEGFGGAIISSYPQYHAIRVEIPMLSLEGIAGLPAVWHVRQEQIAYSNTGSVDSEGDVAHAAKSTRAAWGLSGAGVKVGVLSDGSGNLAGSQASGDLPANVQILGAGSGSEGTAMMEIIHDLAPGSPLAFKTANGGEAAFAQNIHDLANAGCKVICDDITYLAEPAFQDGVVAQAIDDVSQNDGVFFFTSAGNENRLSANNSGVWQGDFNFSGTSDSAGQYHAWSGTNFSNGVTITGGTPVNLQWSDAYGASGNDYDLYLVDSGGNVIASSTNTQDGNDFPYEGTGISNNGLRAIVVKFSGNARYLRLNAFRATLAFRTNGQTYAHHTAKFAFDVAAVDARNRATAFTANNKVETFSSDGPRKLFYNADGSAITPGNFLASGGTVRNKPDIAAADGVVTSVPGFDPFYGTSAAAPHAAAIAALLLEHKSNHTFNTMYSLFEDTAFDIMAPGWDVDSGVGLIMADSAVEKQVQDSYQSLTAASTSLSVGDVTTATIKLSSAAPPSGLDFKVHSADSSKVSVPGTVHMNGGQKTKTFNITAVANTTGTDVTAKLDPTGPTKTLTIVVGGGGGGDPTISTVTLTPASVFGGDTSTGKVTLTGAAKANMTISLKSFKLAAATVPATVNIPKNATSATFTITTKPQVLETTVKIQASKNGSGTASATLTVKSPKLTKLSFSPASVKGGNSSTGTVTLNFPAPTGGLVVTLVSADSARVKVPATVKIVAGQTSKTFTATTTTGNAKQVRVTASADGSTNVSGNLSLTK